MAENNENLGVRNSPVHLITQVIDDADDSDSGTISDEIEKNKDEKCEVEDETQNAAGNHFLNAVLVDSVFTQPFSQDSEGTVPPPDSVHLPSLTDRLEKKRLNRKIKALEERLEKFISGKKESDEKIKELSRDLAKERRAVKALEKRFDTANLKVQTLKDQLKKSISGANAAEKKADTLQKKCNKLMLRGPKKVISEDSVAFATLDLEVKRLRKEVEGLKTKNSKLTAEKGKLNQTVTSLQAENSVLRAENQSKKYEADLKKMELKRETMELGIKRDLQRAQERIEFEKKKSTLQVEQLQAKYEASEALKKATFERKRKEVEEKQAAFENKKKAAYFGTNMVSFV